MKNYSLYKVKLGYASEALVKIKSLCDFIFIFKYSPVGSNIGKVAFLLRLISSILLNKKSYYELPFHYYENNECFILIPWSQSRNEKYCLITKKSFSKHSKSNRSISMLKHEYDGAKYFKKILDSKSISINIPKFISNDEGVVLTYPLLKGRRNNGKLNFQFNHRKKIRELNSTEYYINSEKIIKLFIKERYPSIYYPLVNIIKKYSSIKVNIAPMHGDLSNSNILKVGDELVLIDFEEYIIDGVDIEEDYYKFRYEFDRNKKFKISSEMDFLCVFHYILFQSKNESHFVFKNLSLSENEIRLTL